MSNRHALLRRHYDEQTVRPGASLPYLQQNASQENLDIESGFSYTNQEQTFDIQREFGCLRGVLWALVILALPYGLVIWWIWPTR